jgi:hypothetical protein
MLKFEPSGCWYYIWNHREQYCHHYPGMITSIMNVWRNGTNASIGFILAALPIIFRQTYRDLVYTSRRRFYYLLLSTGLFGLWCNLRTNHILELSYCDGL